MKWLVDKRKKQGSASRATPTVPLDPKQITSAVEQDLKDAIQSLPEIAPKSLASTYEAALRSIRGGSLHILVQELVTLGIGQRRGGDIALYLSNRASAIMQVEQQRRLGIKRALWLYSGAPCGHAEQDAAHKAANGKPYLVSEGMLLQGRRTFPGREEGCKCIAKSIIPGSHDA